MDNNGSFRDKQEGGSHYKDMKIQPIDFIVENEIKFREGNIIKYAARHENKNGAEDLKKVIHYAQMILETEYYIKSDVTYELPTKLGNGFELTYMSDDKSTAIWERPECNCFPFGPCNCQES